MSTKNLLFSGARLYAFLIAGLLAAPGNLLAQSPLPVVGIKAIDPFAREPGSPDPLALVAPDTAVLLVTRSRGTNVPLTVHYSVSGSASNGVDYKKLDGEVVIPAGELSAKLEVEALPDNADETTETVAVKLEELNCIAIFPPPPDCYAVNPAMSSATAYILDREGPNEPPKASMVSPPDGAVIPGPTDIKLVAAAADVDGWVRSVEFFEGTNSLGIVQNPPIAVDPNRESGMVDFEMEFRRPIYPFQLTWSNVPPGVHVLTALATDNDGAATKSSSVEIKIIELPRQPIVTVVASDPHAAEPDPTTDQLDTATFVVRRSGGDPGIPLTVHYTLDGSAKNGVDYKELLLTVVIPGGERSARIVVEPTDDALAEGAEKVLITIQPPACIEIFPPPPDCYLVGRPRQAVAYICDNDLPNRPPMARLVHPVDGQVFRAGADITLAAAAWDHDGSIRQVEFFEGTNSLGVVTEPWPDPDLPTRLILPLYRLVWSNVPPGHFVLTAVATDNAGESGVSEPAEIKVVEPKPPVTVTVEATDPEGEEISPLLDRPANPAVFMIKRDGETNTPLTVYYRLGGTAENGVDYAELPEKVIIPEGNWSAELVIDPIDDNKVEGTETVWIKLVPSLCVNLFPPRWDCYSVGNAGEARAIILDDDRAPSNQPPTVRLLLPIDGEVFAGPADITLL
ncbi:MAG TPA: Calx-beta domain-containing protein, partial [Verrucomicrobiae bacterium]|nr:Calx-beta domain-containing protein [Verrucomicrobiae bacterium]